MRVHGGYAPSKRTRHARQLSSPEREEISRGLAQGLSVREIARRLSCSPSTISREVRRHGGAKSYRANVADQEALANALRPKECKLASRPKLCDLIADKLRSKWSPQQISGWLSRHFPYDEEMQISHETIYKSLYVQARGIMREN